VRKLPHQLVEAFRSTLEVVRDADLLVHVVDGSAADAEGQIDAVREVLGAIDAGDVPELLAVNKADRSASAGHLADRHPDSVVISALAGTGMAALVQAIGDRLRVGDTAVELVVPFDRGDVLAAVHREGEVLVEAHGEGGTMVQVVLDEAGKARFSPFVVGMERAGEQ